MAGRRPSTLQTTFALGELANMLNIPTDARTAAFRAIVNRLKNDPVLNPVIKKWSAMPMAVPGLKASDMPYMQIGLAAGPISVSSPNSHQSNLTITLDYAVNAAGNDEPNAWADIINLYGQIEKAIDPFGDMAWLRDAIAAVDATAVLRGQITITQAGFTSTNLADINALGARCTLSVPLKIDTCRSK